MDLNADVGEGFGLWRLGDDDALLDVVSSANVACGFHAGDPSLLRRTCAAAARRGVVIGAQVGYRDLAGFGRRFLDVDPYDLTNDVIYQVGALDALARSEGAAVAYVKPHGALYNAAVAHEAQAAAVVDAVTRYTSSGLAVLGLPGSALLRLAAEAGLPTVGEFFADRAYSPDGTLVPRSVPGAVIDNPSTVAERCVRFVQSGSVVTVDGSALAVPAASMCVHGDTPGAVVLARIVRATIEDAGGTVRSFARP